MRKISVLILVSIVCINSVHAQTNTFPKTGSAGIGTLTPDASSLLDITSTTKGILIPRMTKAQRDLIGSPVTGLMIYQTNNTPGFYYYSGSAWTAVSAKGANTKLSNLVAPAALNIDLLPGTDNSINLGSAILRWKNLYTDSVKFPDLTTQTTAFKPYTPGPGISIAGTVISSTGDINGSDDANLSLSNLISTGVNQSLIPNTSNTKDLGSAITPWRDIFLGGDIYLNDRHAISFIGTNNTFVGINAGDDNNGTSNTFVGKDAGLVNLNGNNNSFFGALAGHANTAGQNSFFGTNAGKENTTGINNAFYGFNAGLLNTTANFNSFFGSQAGDANTTGASNSFFGTAAGSSNTTAGNNAFFGTNAGGLNTIGAGNSFFGTSAGIANINGSFNSFFGQSAGNSNTTADENSFFGYVAGFNNTTGSNNAFFGNSAGGNNTTGVGLAAFGSFAGTNRPGNSFCTFFGWDSDNKTATNLSNANAFGYQSRVTAANTCRIGNSVMASIGGFADWSNISDARFKKNVKENVKGLDFINRLRPVTYNLDVTGLKHFMKEDNAENMPASQSKEMQDAIAVKEKEIKTGFIAQEVETAAKASGYDFSGVDKPQNDASFYGLRYAEFTVPLVKAVQELSKMNDAKDAKINDLQKQNDVQQQQIDELKTMVLSIQQKQDACSPCNTSGVATQTYNTNINDATALEQNVPNPFTHNTSIGYTLPQKFTTAQIMITDKNGKTLKLINVSGAGKGKVNVDASTLASGAYNYSLLLDGKLIGTKQMMLAK